MPYQSENCVIHGYEFQDDYHDNDAIDFSHWENDDNSIIYFIPTIEDENELNIFLIHRILHRLLDAMIIVQHLTRNTI